METPPTSNPDSRWNLMRDVLVFQAKLLVDGLRDLLMSPASVMAALLGILTEREDPGRHFNRLRQFGYRTERWINLFGRYGDSNEDPGIDEMFSNLEQRIVRQYERGGLTASAKHTIDRSLDGLHDRVARMRAAGSGESRPGQRSKSSGDQDRPE